MSEKKDKVGVYQLGEHYRIDTVLYSVEAVVLEQVTDSELVLLPTPLGLKGAARFKQILYHDGTTGLIPETGMIVSRAQVVRAHLSDLALA